MSTPTPLDIDALLDNRATRVVVCCGAGGVGKTTTAAALALRSAERGRSVVVLTIDPARRLAQSLGLPELTNNPRLVAPTAEIQQAGGQLHAMMLDMRRTFDEMVQAHASPERAAHIIAHWGDYLPKFRKVMPIEYRRALAEMKAQEVPPPRLLAAGA